MTGVIVAMDHRTALRRAREEASTTGRRHRVEKLAPYWRDRVFIPEAWAVLEVETPPPAEPISCDRCSWTYLVPFPGVDDPLDAHRDVCGLD